jgi:quercetin dioxygenase-like cupin family protein
MKKTVAMGPLLVLTLMACGGESPAPTVPQPPAPAPTATQAESAPQPAPAPTATEAQAPAPPDTGGYTLVAPSSLQYQPLMPGQPGPEVAFVHGDMKSGGAFFLRVPPGGKPGIHTHTSDYHAMVVSGAPKHWLVGGDAKAKPLAPGSYWFQPGGQPHGDECTGKDPCVLFVVMPGAFDFTPAPKAKPGPVGKYTMTARKDIKFNPFDPKKPDGPKLGILSGDPKTGPVAFMIEVPAGANVGMHQHTNDYQAVTIDGGQAHWLPGDANQGAAAVPGTYWFQPGGYDHGDRCVGTAPCHTFVYLDKALDFLPPKSAGK